MGAIFNSHVLHLSSNFLLHEMSCKKKTLFQKDMPEKRCAVIKSYWWNMGKKWLFIEKIIMSHRRKLCQVFKKKYSEIVWYQSVVKEEKYSEENIVSIHWQILQLLIVAVPVHQVSKKRQFYRGRRNYCLFSLCYIVQFC